MTTTQTRTALPASAWGADATRIDVAVRREMQHIYLTEGSIALGRIADNPREPFARRTAAQQELDFLSYDGDCDRWG